MAINVVLSTDELTVLGPPASIDLQVDVGPRGERGSYIYSGSVDPNTSSTPFVNQEPKIGDLYFRTSNNSIYQYTTVPGGTQWIELLSFTTIVDNATNLYNAAAALSASASETAELAEDYADLALQNALSASTNYLLNSAASATYLSLLGASANYLSISDAQSDYLSKTDAATTYATFTDLNNLDTLPSQTGNNGKFLSTDGNNPSWETVDLDGTIQTASAAAVTALRDSVIAGLNTLNKIASAINNDENFSTTIANTYLTQAAAVSGYSPRYYVENVQSSDYTLTINDINKVIAMDNSASAQVIVPPNSEVAFPVGTVINVCRMNEGLVFITQGDGVTVQNSGYIYNRYSEISLRKRDTNEWILSGNVI